MNLRRLSADWQAVYGHPIVLAETFVESPRFTGACYRTPNWRDVGWTKGFARLVGLLVACYPMSPEQRRRFKMDTEKRKEQKRRAAAKIREKRRAEGMREVIVWARPDQAPLIRDVALLNEDKTQKLKDALATLL
jgi:hypothetical protein